MCAQRIASEPATVPDELILQPGLPLSQLEKRLGIAYIGGGLRHRACAFYLQDVEARGLHTLAGFRSTAQYAARRFGMSGREARDLLMVGRALLELPRIDDAFAEGRLLWTKVRQLVRVATPKHEVAWIELAERLNADELTLEVKLAKPGEAPRDHDDRKGLPEVRLDVHEKVPPDVYAKWEHVQAMVRNDAKAPCAGWECLEAAFDALLSGQTGKPIPPVVIHVGEGEGPATVDTEDGPVPLDPVTAETLGCGRRAPEAVRRKIWDRDHHRCRCCGTKYRLHEDHIIPWSEGGKSVEKNLLLLCRSCHTLKHAGLLTIVGDADDARFVDREGRDLHGDATRLKELLFEQTGETRRLILRKQGPGEVGTACQPSDGPPPERFCDLVGQTSVMPRLEVAVKAAVKRNGPIRNTLLSGLPGLGKTTLARAMAGERGVRLHATSGPLLQTPLSLIQMMLAVAPDEVLFIDEIHTLPRAVAETLYERMDDGVFTLIGSTTDAGELPAAFRSRFMRYQLDLYKPSELTELIARFATRHEIDIDRDAAAEIASVSRETPRVAVQLLRSVADDALVADRMRIDVGVVARVLDSMGIDGLGLDVVDRRYLDTLRGSDLPISLSRLSAILSVDMTTLREHHEPYLFRLGLAATMPSGRVATVAVTARSHGG